MTYLVNQFYNTNILLTPPFKYGISAWYLLVVIIFSSNADAIGNEQVIDNQNSFLIYTKIKGTKFSGVRIANIEVDGSSYEGKFFSFEGVELENVTFKNFKNGRNYAGFEFYDSRLKNVYFLQSKIDVKFKGVKDSTVKFEGLISSKVDISSGVNNTLNFSKSSFIALSLSLADIASNDGDTVTVTDSVVTKSFYFSIVDNPIVTLGKREFRDVLKKANISNSEFNGYIQFYAHDYLVNQLFKENAVKAKKATIRTWGNIDLSDLDLGNLDLKLYLFNMAEVKNMLNFGRVRLKGLYLYSNSYSPIFTGALIKTASLAGDFSNGQFSKMKIDVLSTSGDFSNSNFSDSTIFEFRMDRHSNISNANFKDVKVKNIDIGDAKGSLSIKNITSIRVIEN